MDDDEISCDDVSDEEEVVATVTVAVEMREERAAMRSEAEMGRHEGSSVLASSGVEGGGDTRGVAVALAEEF